MRNYTVIFAFLMALLLSACKKDAGTIQETYKEKIVVDAWIEAGQYAKVLLTQSADYYASMDSASIRQHILSKASVKMRSGIYEEYLTLRYDNAYFPPYVYVATDIKGEVGYSYKLTAYWDGDSVTAETTIPGIAYLDSLHFKYVNDSQGVVNCILYDDETVENFYRLFTKRIGKDSSFVPVYSFSSFGDKFFDGNEFDVTLYKGNNGYEEIEGNAPFFHETDSIQIKISSIDEESFAFWSKYDREIYNFGNPFATANDNLESNVKGGLGIFTGMGSSLYTIHRTAKE